MSSKLSAIVVGDFGVGKTSLLVKYTEGTFDESKPTVGVDQKVADLEIDGCGLQLVIKDTAGQERFGGITCSNFRGVGGVILAFDVANRKSYEAAINNWTKEIDRYAKEAIVFLVGTKCDINEREVTTEEATEYATTHKLTFFETSAKNNTNVEETFVQLANAIYERKKGIKTSATSSATIDLNTNMSQGTKKKKGCILF